MIMYKINIFNISLKKKQHNHNINSQMVITFSNKILDLKNMISLLNILFHLIENFFNSKYFSKSSTKVINLRANAMFRLIKLLLMVKTATLLLVF